MSILLKKRPKNEKRHILTEGAQLERLLTIPPQIWGDSHKNGHMNEAWAVNQWRRGFTAQLSESWAYLSPYSAEQKKNTHSCLFISSLFLYPPHPPALPPPSPLWWMEGTNSPRPPRVSLWGPRQLNKQRALNLKAQSGIYLNHVRFGYICVWPWSAREGTWKRDFCRAVITENLDFFPLSFNKL